MSTRWYPIYQRGNPQLRVFLPNFWMKMVKPNWNQHGASAPQNKVQFIVSSQMTKYDVKNYLEKIYKVQVADVKTLNHMGKTFQNEVSKPGSGAIMKEDDYKLAFVTLPPGEVWEWPDLKIAGSSEKREEEYKEELKQAKEKRKQTMRADDLQFRPHVPPFFGL